MLSWLSSNYNVSINAVVLNYIRTQGGEELLTRTSIIEHVWDVQYDSMTNIVDVHIRSLRAKLDRDHTPQLIHTIRGVGYVIKTPNSS